MGMRRAPGARPRAWPRPRAGLPVSCARAYQARASWPVRFGISGIRRNGKAESTSPARAGDVGSSGGEDGSRTTSDRLCRPLHDRFATSPDFIVRLLSWRSDEENQAEAHFPNRIPGSNRSRHMVPPTSAGRHSLATATHPQMNGQLRMRLTCRTERSAT